MVWRGGRGGGVRKSHNMENHFERLLLKKHRARKIQILGKLCDMKIILI
jgi:hypothetical protein